MLPQLIHIGDFFVPTYGVLVAAGFLLALWLATRLAARAGLDKEAVLNLGIYCGLAGILGAKLLMIVLDLGYYLRNPGELFSMSTLQAGGVFYGGLILALITAFWYMRKSRLPGLATSDVFAPGLALGHAVGRLGCFAAGCCWGLECHRPWAVTFEDPAAHRGSPALRHAARSSSSSRSALRGRRRCLHRAPAIPALSAASPSWTYHRTLPDFVCGGAVRHRILPGPASSFRVGAHHGAMDIAGIGRLRRCRAAAIPGSQTGTGILSMTPTDLPAPAGNS
jgi:hypothetical protein